MIGDFITAGGFTVGWDYVIADFAMIEDFVAVKGFVMVGYFEANVDLERVVIDTHLG